MNLSGAIRINRFGILVIAISCICLWYFVIYANSYRSDSEGLATNGINLRKLLIASIQAARLGGVEVFMVSKQNDFKESSKGKLQGGINDPVTEADFKSHCVMQFGLTRLFPKLKVISEESVPHSKCPSRPTFDIDSSVIHNYNDLVDVIVNPSDVTVWIDPLDATKEFTEHLFQYVTTMVCVAVKGLPTIGVIHNPFTNETTWAWVDVINSFNSVNYAVTKEASSNYPVIIVSRSHKGDVDKFVVDTFGQNSRVITAAGAGYKVLQVLSNNANAYLHRTKIKKWDICAGNAILSAAGGQMSDLYGQQLDYADETNVVNDRGILATIKNHEEYLEKLKKYV